MNLLLWPLASLGFDCMETEREVGKGTEGGLCSGKGYSSHLRGWIGSHRHPERHLRRQSNDCKARRGSSYVCGQGGQNRQSSRRMG